MTTPLDHPTILRSNLGRMRQLGAGHHIVEHWKAERLTAIGTAPLSIWFIVQMLRLGDADHKDVVQWAGKPVNTVLLLSLMILTFHHMQMGLQVITSDYSRGKNKTILDLIIKGGTFFLGLLSVISILKIALAPAKK
ncbi:Succinate dehydrogenase [Commensalibacter communis]|uniref:Succinate dehydrogenase hydrophobic membrane anchor subunit n=1 Tax=Commensalibacter communis TaxID=2972786 RepID=A0A9W4XD79_9PROT|nr:Succinate dehydrogenase [Commensalibacter communis]CAI3938805.1 Succinate dehydrogenase [Commensalibacter communis]CAI3939607.1 Succinate dehydrogenase [Commensalibacter communis]CAI3941548.1 Succinate dehydrogenase [Commensalibacter communis]CAI3941943.1 Succinate dehydrogenase [Commensalibacter communis]